MPAQTTAKQIKYPISADDPRVAPGAVFKPAAERIDELFQELENVANVQILSGYVTHTGPAGGNSSTANYSFPANKWTAAPLIVASGRTNARCNIIAIANSTSEFQIEAFNPTTTASSNMTVSWIAIGPTA